MTAGSPRPVSILVAALGGQGGGVFSEWLVAAATLAGVPAQATSIPGVAQRTGATTYYLEVFPERPPAGAPEPVFSLYPTAGDVDVIVAAELLEAGRALELDYASPDRTTLIASTHRLFAIGEKTTGGVFPRERLEEAARQLSRRLVALDALETAWGARSEVNAVLLGALAATRALPIEPAHFEAAIRDGGVAVERNLSGFRAGVAAVAGARAGSAPPAAGPAPGARRGALAARIEAEFPVALHQTLREAVARLVDYQGLRHAAVYLDRVRRVSAADPEGLLSRAFARRLAVWMSYEDAIRVADLKTRRERFERIRAEQGAGDGAVVVVTDYLKPDLDELYGILPEAIGAPIARWAERRWPERRPTITQHARTTSVLGFLRVWVLGRLRVLRPASLRHRRESALMARWEGAVLESAALDGSLAVEVAELASVVRGYGEVRRRLSRGLAHVLDVVLPAAVVRDRAQGGGYARAARAVGDARRRLLEEEHGVEAVCAIGEEA